MEFVEMLDGMSHIKPEDALSNFADEETQSVEQQGQQKEQTDQGFIRPEIIIIFIVILLVAQIILIAWKRKNFKSYQRTTLLGLWLLPLGASIMLAYIRFCIVWGIFSVITAFVAFKASRKPLSGSTPRWVYKWFLLVYKVSYALGIIGYLTILLTFFGIHKLVSIESKTSVDFSLLLLFYGLYFGVVSRDLAEVCTDIMATHIGYCTVSGLPAKRLSSNTCAVCGCEIFLTSNDSVTIEKTINLNCGHIFHEFCIRGWCIVGKKQTCPYCKEKVDLKRMFPGPWERPHLLHGSLLDCIRYFVVWNPFIIAIANIFTRYLGFDLQSLSSSVS
uniref:RING-type domain-containing protein n=1 Tax=Arion vulgaris TaxID=1028688 RepID=A0A0B6YSW6_9EUPU